MQLYVYVTIVFITSSCDAFLLLQDFFFFCFPCVWLFFNWRKIALQCCVGFCPTTMQTDHNYMYISLPSVSASCIPRIPALWVVTERRAGLLVFGSSFPLAVMLRMVVYICQGYFLNSYHPLLPPLCPQVRFLRLHL